MPRDISSFLARTSTNTSHTELDTNDRDVIAGAHGTIGEQTNEEYYDDRSDADGDIQKGKIRFPCSKLYGREEELKTLHSIYQQVAGNDLDNYHDREEMAPSEVRPRTTCRVVFLGGLAGTGKSALVNELIARVSKDEQFDQQQNHQPTQSAIVWEGQIRTV